MGPLGPLDFHSQLKKISDVNNEQEFINMVMGKPLDFSVPINHELGQEVSDLVIDFLKEGRNELEDSDKSSLENLQVIVHIFEVRSGLQDRLPTELEKTIAASINLLSKNKDLTLHSSAQSSSDKTSSKTNVSVMEQNSTKAKRDAASLFALMNLGSSAIKMTDLKYNSSLALSFTIKCMKNALLEGLIPEAEKKTIKQLIRSYSKGLEILQMQEFLKKSTQSFFPDSAEKIQLQKKLISKKIISTLEEDGEIYLMTGYAATPAGHTIGLKLILEKDTGNGCYIRGEVYNRGEGVDTYHGTAYIHDLKRKILPILSLDPVFIDELSSSNFLDSLTELKFGDYPNLPYLVTPEGDPIISPYKTTEYSIKDFYESALTLWPGQISKPQDKFFQSYQRGGTCTIKAGLMPLKSLISTSTKAHIKLKMRLDSMKDYLATEDLQVYHIPQLEWSIKKINLALLKLIDNQQATIKEIQACDQLTAVVNEKIKEIRLERSNLLQQATIQHTADFSDDQDYKINTSNIPPLKSDLNISQEKDINFLNDFKDAVLHVKRFVLNTRDQSKIRLHANGFLQTVISEVKNDDWMNCNSEMISAFSKILKYLAYSGSPNKNLDENYITLSSFQLLPIANTFVNILMSLKESKKISQDYIDYFASTLLKLLQEGGTQLRISNPFLKKYLENTIDLLNRLNKGSYLADSLAFNTNFIHPVFIKKIYHTTSEVMSDPVVEFIYRYLEKKPYYQSSLILDSKKEPMRPLSLIDRAVMLTDKNLLESSPNLFPHFDMLYGLNTLLEPLYFGLSVSGKITDADPLIIDKYSYDNVKKAPGRMTFFSDLIPDDPKNPSYGILCDAFYPWNDSNSEGNLSERNFVRQLLDRRMKIGKNACPRETQNEQLVSGQQNVYFGKTFIPAEEYQELLAITTSDESLIPQCIHYFDQHFSRLKDPRFQALFEAFFWTMHSDGQGSVLSKVLADSNSNVADHLLTFLDEKLKKSQRGKLLPQQLILTRFLAQVYGHLQMYGPKNRCDKAKDLLANSMLNLMEEKKSQNQTIEVWHWIVSLFPYLMENFTNPVRNDLTDICRAAYKEISTNEYGNYDFNKRYVVSDDYAFANAFFENEVSDQEVSSGKLPLWILNSNSYILSNKNPKVTKVSQDPKDLNSLSLGSEVKGDDLISEIYEFEDNGIPTRISCLGKTFKISQFMADEKGIMRWFSYSPNNELPAISELPKNHPCSTEKDNKGYFITSGQIWLSEPLADHAPEAIVLSRKDRKVLCRITDRIVKGDDQLYLSSAYSSTNPIFEKLLSLDNPKDILIWKDDYQKIQEFNFPNLGLQFNRKESPDGPRWICNNPQGYFLDTTTIVSELDPYKHYVILQNAKGKKIVLMPNHQIVPSEKTLLSWSQPKPKLTKDPELLIYQLDNQNRILPSDNPRHISYLFHLALHNNEFLKARHLLENLARHSSDWSAKEVEMMASSWIENGKAGVIDMHPYACALRIKLRLIKMHAIHDTQANSDEIALKRDYLACLDQINILDSDWLSEKDEREIIDIFLTNGPKENIAERGVFTNRWIELNNNNSDKFVFNYDIKSDSYTKKINTSSPRPPEWLSDPVIQKTMLECMKNPQPIALLMRPGEAFFLNFLHYYKIASEGRGANGKEFSNLMDILQLTKLHKDPAVQFFRNILLALALKDPQVHSWPRISELATIAKQNKLHEKLSIFAIEDLEEMPDWSFKSKINNNEKKHKQTNPVLTNFQRITKPLTLLSNLIEYERPMLNQAPVIQGVLNSKLTEEDPTAKIQYFKDEISSLKSLSKVYHLNLPDPSIDTSFKQPLQGIQKEIHRFEREVVKVQEGSKSYCLSIFSEAKKNLSNAQKSEEINSLLENLNASITDTQKKLEIVETAILTRIQNYPPELKRHMYEPMELKELIACFGKKDDNAILRANPSLKDQLGDIKRQLAEYLVNKTELQVLQRSEQILKEAFSVANVEGWDSIVAYNACERFVSSISAKRAYDSNNPAFETFLVFEALSNMRLRNEQVSALTTLTGDALLDLELEASTGFGKSKVVIPLWLFLTSRKDRLTMMTVPTALLPDQVIQLKDLLGNMFKVGIKVINFDRKKGGSLAYLIKLNEQLAAAKKEKKVALLSIKSLQGLTSLSSKQALFLNTSDDPNEVTLEIIKLRKFLSQNASNFIDESRECCDIRQRYDYAIGQPKPINPKYCHEVGRFYHEVVLHPDILKHWSFEFLPPELDPKGKIATQEDFEKSNKKGLSMALAVRMVAYMGVEEKYQPAMQDYLLGIPSDDAKAYIIKMKQEKPEQYKLYCLCVRQMVTYLPRTLVKKCHESYDLSPNGIARPSHRGEVKHTSEFTKDDLINLTIQANLKIDLSKEKVEDYIDHLKEQFLLREAGALSDPTHQLFLGLRKELNLPPLKAFASQDVERLVTFLNSPRGFSFRLRFISTFLLPKITIFPKKISGTPFTMMSSLHNVQAASGTPDPDTMPPRIKTISNPTASIANLHAIWKNSSILETSIKDPRELFKHLIFNEFTHSVITDAAGDFRDLSENEMAEIVFNNKRQPTINGFVFYDNEGKCFIRERGQSLAIPREESSLPPEEIIVFIRQSKAIGADTPMTSTAKSWVTVGRDTTESLLVQAAGRMRKLGLGQSVDIVVLEEDAIVMKNKLGLDPHEKLTKKHILQYVKIVDEQQKKENYYYSLRLYLESLVEDQLWTKIENPHQLISLFRQLQTFLVESTEIDLLSAPSPVQEPFTAKQAVDVLKASILNPLKENAGLAKILDLASIEAAFDKHVQISKLPRRIKFNMGSEDIAAEVEHETVDEAGETEQDYINDEISDLPQVSFNPSVPLAWKGNYTYSFQGKPKDFLGLPVYSSLNFSTFERGKDLSDVIQRPSYQSVIKKNIRTGQLEILAIDLHDMKAILNRMRHHRKKEDCPTDSKHEYYLVEKGAIIASDAAKNPTRLSEIFSGDELIRVELLGKILSGDRYLSTLENQWIKQLGQTNPKAAKELLDLVHRQLKVMPKLTKLAAQIESLL